MKRPRPKFSKRLLRQPSGGECWEIALEEKGMTEDQKEFRERHEKLEKWKQRIEKGDLVALRMLRGWAESATLELNSIQNLSFLKQFCKNNGVTSWPVLTTSKGKVDGGDLKRVQDLELRRAERLFDVRNLNRQQTLERRVILRLLTVVLTIREKLEYLSPEEFSQTIRWDQNSVEVPISLKTECKNLPIYWVAPKADLLKLYWDIIRELFELATGDKYHEDPSFKQKYRRSSTRRGDNENSARAIAMIRSDICKRLRETLSSLMGSPPKD